MGGRRRRVHPDALPSRRRHRGHSHPAVGVLGVQPVPVRRHGPVVTGAAPSRRHRRGPGGSGGTVAATVRAGDDDRPQVVDGFTKKAITEALATVGAVEVTVGEGTPAWLAPDDAEPAQPVTGVGGAAARPRRHRHGFEEHDWYLDPGMVPKLFDTVGNAGNTVLVSGRVVGAWGQRPDGSVVVGLLDRIGAASRRLVDAEAAGSPTGSTARWSPPGSRHRSSRS